MPREKNEPNAQDAPWETPEELMETIVMLRERLAIANADLAEAEDSRDKAEGDLVQLRAQMDEGLGEMFLVPIGAEWDVRSRRSILGTFPSWQLAQAAMDLLARAERG